MATKSTEDKTEVVDKKGTATKKAPAKKATAKKAEPKKETVKKDAAPKVESESDLRKWFNETGTSLIRKGVSNKKFVALALQASGKGDKAQELQKAIEDAGINRSSGATVEIIELIEKL